MARLMDKDEYRESLIHCKGLGRHSLEAVLEHLEKQPTDEAIPKCVYDQVRWERDIAIEQLNSYGVQFGEKAELQRKPEWISVKDRMPEIEERVLVYGCEDGINFGYFLGYEDGFFIECVYPNEPTHWMPLPELPKREGE